MSTLAWVAIGGVALIVIGGIVLYRLAMRERQPHRPDAPSDYEL